MGRAGSEHDVLTTSKVRPPAVATKYELVHSAPEDQTTQTQDSQPGSRDDLPSMVLTMAVGVLLRVPDRRSVCSLGHHGELDDRRASQLGPRPAIRSRAGRALPG
jgi:hypothetical protein